MAPTEREIVRAFDRAGPLTVGLEEELMLLDPRSGTLAPVAPRVLAGLGEAEGDPSFKLELPAAHLEIVTAPQAKLPAALAALRRGRARVAEAAEGLARPAGAAVHPTAPPEGELNRGPRYDRTAREYGGIARRQLVCAFQVHVACGGAERSLAVYNALRRHLPEIAALAANAPFYAGADTGMASVRPKLCELLPRQGVPPELGSWAEYAEALSWGERSGTIPDPGNWWWELRPHPGFGTLELRVPDSQTTVREAAGVAAFSLSLVASLCAAHDAGELLPGAPAWRIAENRWRAARDGVLCEFADLDTGEPVPARERLGALIEELGPHAERLGCREELKLAAELVRENGAMRQRAAATEAGIEALPEWLADRWLA